MAFFFVLLNAYNIVNAVHTYIHIAYRLNIIYVVYYLVYAHVYGHKGSRTT